MTNKQLENFNKKLSSFQEAELLTCEHKTGEKLLQYLLVWWIDDSSHQRKHLDFIFTIYNNCVLHRFEIDGYLRSYVLKALEEIMKQ